MKEFICEWFKITISVCLFFCALSIIIIPTIIADKFIDNHIVSALFSFVWATLSTTFFVTIAIRKVRKEYK